MSINQQCFGDTSTPIDTRGLSPVQSLGRLQALHLSSPDEHDQYHLLAPDATMVNALPHLIEINKRGFLTTDSQMGRLRTIGGGSPSRHRQRSYVTGVLPKHMGQRFVDIMEATDSVVVRGNPVGDVEWTSGHRFVYYFPVTSYDGEMFTHVPMTTHTMDDVELVPTVQWVLDEQRCSNLVKQDAFMVEIADAVWGRPYWLFDKILEVLEQVSE